MIDVKNYPVDEELNTKLKPFYDKGFNDANQVIGTLVGGDLTPSDEIQGITQAQIQDTPVMDLILNTQLYYTKPYLQ